jgi:hypothetical protein
MENKLTGTGIGRTVLKLFLLGFPFLKKNKNMCKPKWPV